MVPLFLSLFVSFLSLCDYYSNIYLPIGESSVHLMTITGQWEYVTTPEAVLPSSIRLIPEIPLVPNTIKAKEIRSKNQMLTAPCKSILPCLKASFIIVNSTCSAILANFPISSR